MFQGCRVCLTSGSRNMSALLPNACQHQGCRERDRSKEEAACSVEEHAADHRNEDRNGVQTQPPTQHDGVKQIPS
jgi:hypothetical protein